MPIFTTAGLVAAGAAVAGGVASSVAGGLINGKSSGQQSGAISSGLSQANQVLQPYVDTGTNALTKYADFAGINGPDAAATAMNDFKASPGYDYQVQQGLRAVDAGAASKGILRSGATLKAEQTLGNNLANQDFSNYLARLNNLAGFGIQGAGGQSSNDTGAATQQASIYSNEGKGLSNAVTGGIGSLTNGLTKYYGAGGVNSSSVYNDPTGLANSGSGTLPTGDYWDTGGGATF